MKRLSLLTLLAILCFILPVVAQDEMKEDAGTGAEMTPPPALDDEFLSWLVGEWEGTSEGTMGTSKDNYKMSIGLNSQGKFKFVLAEGESVRGPIPATGNTNTRGFFGPDIRAFLKRWVAEGPTHHFALGVGHHAATIQKIAESLNIEYTIVPGCVKSSMKKRETT